MEGCRKNDEGGKRLHFTTKIIERRELLGSPRSLSTLSLSQNGKKALEPLACISGSVPGAEGLMSGCMPV